MSNLLKSLALRAVAQGLHLPDAQLDRVSELTYLRSLLRRLRIDCVLDVGANRGQFASELRAIGYTGHIVSFEPIEREFRALAERFGNDRKWIGHRTALGSAATTMTLTVPRLTVMSSLLASVVPENDAHRESVEVRRLDALLPALVHELGVSSVFLKMDTQGFDLEVFRGASGCMTWIRGIQSELSIKPLYRDMPHYLDALACYESAGFTLFNLSVVNRIETGGLLELNCFMEASPHA